MFSNSSLESIEFGENIEIIGEQAFQGCTFISNITLNSKLKAIGYRAFRDSGIKSIVIPDSVTEIADEAFSGCEKLKNLTIGKNVKSIGTEAFRNTTTLNQINYNAVNLETFGEKVFRYAGSKGNGIDVVFGEEVEVIPSKLFYAGTSSVTTGAPNIISIYISASVQSVGERAFQYLANLEEVTIDSSAVYEAAKKTDSKSAGGLLQYVVTNLIEVKVLSTADTGNNVLLSNGTFDVNQVGNYNVYVYNPSLVPETPNTEA